MSLPKVRKLLSATSQLGAGPILKAIGNIAPGIGSFVSGAFTAGYAADQIADFLRNKLSTPEERRNRSMLEAKASQGMARPDQRAELSQIEQRMAPLESAGALARMGIQAAGGLGAAGMEANQREADLERQQAVLQQEEAARQQEEADRAYRRERDLQLDAERQRESKEESLRKQRAEQRATETHVMRMKKGVSPSKATSAPKAALNPAAQNAKPPNAYLDAIKELDELIRRIS